MTTIVELPKPARFHRPVKKHPILAEKPMVRDDEEGPWMTVRQHQEILGELAELLQAAVEESTL